MGKRKHFPGKPGEGTEFRAERVAEVSRKLAEGFYTGEQGVDGLSDVLASQMMELLFSE
tara:strand:+ start:509 stop:685 length:177 start_codon:yes stop_codon:yes gene_type:complete